MLGITLRSAEINKLGVDEGSGMILSDVSIEVTWVGNIEGAGPGEGEPWVNSVVNRVGNKLGVSDGEVTGIKIRVS